MTNEEETSLLNPLDARMGESLEAVPQSAAVILRGEITVDIDNLGPN